MGWPKLHLILLKSLGAIIFFQILPLWIILTIFYKQEPLLPKLCPSPKSYATVFSQQLLNPRKMKGTEPWFTDSVRMHSHYPTQADAVSSDSVHPQLESRGETELNFSLPVYSLKSCMQDLPPGAVPSHVHRLLVMVYMPNFAFMHRSPLLVCKATIHNPFSVASFI